ncbi:hypothetical protein [Streptomyces wuyuanensis]|uniref:Uncharacterized protein n=1 Tax=Streptomyces wuyuanensis TaxID=1196353 RepID=A0A1G9ZAE1_9ACTN|nr:hypothetical protein [Streptomyces wuyuanensis]SDN18077.1 hypothetical protein SAMN05444921_12138 [Streptomyces wuyuanensis]
MPVPARTQMHDFKARIEDVGTTVLTKSIAAAYFIEEGIFTIFKDGQHQAVYAVQSRLLLRGTRRPHGQ